MRILILDAQTPAGLACVQHLGARGHDLLVASPDPTPLLLASRHARGRLIHQPKPGDDAFASWLKSILEKEAPGLIVPAAETGLLGLLEMPEDSPAWALAQLPSRESLRLALDKQQSWEVAREVGLQTPTSQIWQKPEPPQNLAFPLFLKPLNSKARIEDRWVSLQPRLARDPKDFAGIARDFLRAGPFQVQSWAGGHGFGVECLFDKGEPRWIFTHERLHEMPLTGGGSTYRRSIPTSSELAAPAIRLLEHLQWHGVAMVEFRGTPGEGFTFMEINPRFWGSLDLSLRAGVPFPEGLVHLAEGRSMPPQPTIRPARCRQVLRDVEWIKAVIRADASDPLLLTRPLLPALLEWARILLPSEHWDHCRWEDPGVTRATCQELLGGLTRPLGHRVLKKRAMDRLRRNESRLRQKGNAGSTPPKILFLCYGNICRSPFAEAWLKQRRPDWTVSSSGLHPKTGRTSPGKIVRLASKQDLDLSTHRSRQFTPGEWKNWDWILCMDFKQVLHLMREHPEARDRILLLGRFHPKPFWEIEDPYEASEEETDAILKQLSLSIQGLLGLLAPSETGSDSRNTFS